MSELLDTITGRTREKVNGKKVVAAVSGGGDSTLAAYITEKAGADILAVFVDSGLLREGERARAEELYKKCSVTGSYQLMQARSSSNISKEW